MIRTAVKIVVALLIAHALYQFIPPYVQYHLFKDDVKQTALFAGGAPEGEVAEQVLQHAADRDVPLDRQGLAVWRVGNETFIEAAYEQPIRILPWYTWLWQVEVSASARQLSPRRVGG